MAEPLQWQQPEKLGISNVLQNVEKLTKQVVQREMVDISNKIGMLETMGVIKDTEKFKKIKEQMEQLIRKTNDLNIR